jgi:hypothetical protein
MSRAVRLFPPSALVAIALSAVACRGPTTAAGASTASDLITEAERSGWVRTGRYAETERLCRDFERAFPGRAACEQFGRTLEGRPMLSLVVGRPGPERPVLLVQGGIHAGEIEGKDAGFWFLRDLLAGRVAPGALDAVTVVFVPVLNVDGHERFGPGNRPNQRGPAEMGFRTNSQNLNLNRDYMKVDTPEIAAVLALWKRWSPIVYVDLHTTDGAKFEHDVAVLVAPRAPRPDRVGRAAEALSAALQARVTELGHMPLPFYPAFIVNDDPASGFEDGEPPPRFSQGYAAARGAIGILVETHSWRTYGERARATYHVLQALLERAVQGAAVWRDAEAYADAADTRLAGRDVPLSFRATAQVRTIEFRGYRYERRPSEVSGGTWTIYHEGEREIWKVPLHDQLVPDLTVTAPAAGYLVAPGFAAEVARRLDAHGIRHATIARSYEQEVERFRVNKAEYDPPFEGRTRVRMSGAWTRERAAVAAGSLWIPIAQPRARLLLQLLEPLAADSFASWGFFNACLEQKEYMEAYVAEEVARQMLADPAVKSAFDKALEDPAFAASPARRLDFFYRRHPSWDASKDLLPVMRAAAPPPGEVSGR